MRVFLYLYLKNVRVYRYSHRLIIRVLFNLFFSLSFSLYIFCISFSPQPDKVKARPLESSCALGFFPQRRNSWLISGLACSGGCGRRGEFSCDLALFK